MAILIAFFSFLCIHADPAQPQYAKGNITLGVIVNHLNDLEEQFRLLHEAGFISCQLNYDDSIMTPAFAERTKAASRKYGISISGISGVPGRSVWNFREGPSTIGLVPADGREEKIAVFHRMIDFCHTLGMKYVDSHFGFIPVDMGSYEYKTFIEVMRGLARYARERAVTILMQTGQDTPVTLVHAIRDIGADNIAVNCDVGNMLLYGTANPTDAVRFLAPLLREVHAKDGFYPTLDKPFDLGLQVPIPEGDVDFPAIIGILVRQGYSGAITLEYELDRSTIGDLGRARRYLQGLIDASVRDVQRKSSSLRDIQPRRSGQ